MAVKPEITDQTFKEASELPSGSQKAANPTKKHGDERYIYLTRMAKTWNELGMTQAQNLAEVLGSNLISCEPPLAESEVEKIVEIKSLSSELRLTDTANAELLAELYCGRIKFDHRQRRWLIWNEHRWEPDHNGHIYRLAVEVARIRYQQAEIIQDLKERQRVAKWAIDSESRMRTEACIALARNVEMVAESGDNWDTNTWTLGVNNGVIDLLTGELTKGEPWDRITMTTGVDFDPEAQCPRWEQFLTEVFSDTELIDWLHRALGYSLTGDTTEQCVFIGYGIGANGKGVFCNAIHNAMGDYAYSAPFSTFELYQRASIPNDLAALDFKRFVNSSETNDNTRLNEARLKAISGCDPITARYLHQEFFTFWPHLKLWLFVNHKPKVADDSFGFWRRVRLIPFSKQFIGKAEDKQLNAKLRGEAPGILAWLVRGCLEWQKRGLEPIPEMVKAATQEYRAESDVLASFITEKCIEHPDATTKASDLYSAYKEWAESQGITLRDKDFMTATTFGRRISERYQKERTRDGIFYQGMGLICEGFVKGSEPNITGSKVIPLCSPRMVNNRKNHSQLFTKASDPSQIGAACVKGEGICSLRTDKETFACIYQPGECQFLR